MKNICIIGHNLGFGGVQKNIAMLANHFAKSYRVSIILMDDRQNIHKLNEAIEIIYLPSMKIDNLAEINKDKNSIVKIGLDILLFRIKELESILLEASFDIAIAMEDYCGAVLLESCFDGKKIVSSRALPSAYYSGKIVHFLDEQFYSDCFERLFPKADAIVVVDKAIGDELAKFGVKSTVIQNGVDVDKIKELSCEDIAIKEPFILCVGRVEFWQKGQDNLLEAFRVIMHNIPQNLVFIGDGKDRQALSLMVEKYGIQGRVFVLGFDANPYKYMAKADLFVFPSYFEGQPNVLLEAMALGAICISYDFLPSWSDITKSGEAACVVHRGDIEALSAGILKLVTDMDAAKGLGRLAKDYIARLDISENLRLWSNLLASV